MGGFLGGEVGGRRGSLGAWGLGRFGRGDGSREGRGEYAGKLRNREVNLRWWVLGGGMRGFS